MIKKKKKIRLRQLEAKKRYEIRTAVKIIKPPPPYKIPESIETSEESEVRKLEIDQENSQRTTTPIGTPISTI